MRWREVVTFPALVLCVLASGCGGQRTDAGTLESSVVRVAGTACRKPIVATAFVTGEGTIVTVAHAVAGAKDDLRVVAADGTEHAVTVTGFDKDLDVAVLRVPTFRGVPLESSITAPGEVGVVGAMNRDSVVDPLPYTVTRIVNARSGDIYDRGTVERAAIDVASTADRGTSGAPLVADDGTYIGMVFAISNDRDDAVYALAAEEIERYLASGSFEVEVDRGTCR